MFLRKHLNTLNRGLSVWRSHPNLFLSQRKGTGGGKTFSITELIGATYLIQNAQWFANCLETDVAFFVQSLCMRHRSAQKSRQIMRGRGVKRKQHLWGWNVYWKSFCKQMKESVLYSICSIVAHERVSARTHVKHKTSHRRGWMLTRGWILSRTFMRLLQRIYRYQYHLFFFNLKSVYLTVWYTVESLFQLQRQHEAVLLQKHLTPSAKFDGNRFLKIIINYCAIPRLN